MVRCIFMCHDSAQTLKVYSSQSIRKAQLENKNTTSCALTNPQKNTIKYKLQNPNTLQNIKKTSEQDQKRYMGSYPRFDLLS